MSFTISVFFYVLRHTSIFYMLEKKVYQSLIISRIFYTTITPKLVNDVVQYHYFIASVFIITFVCFFFEFLSVLKISLKIHLTVWMQYFCQFFLMYFEVILIGLNNSSFLPLLLELSHISYINLSFSTDLAEISTLSPFTQQRWTNMFIT